jgi:hypothetical protein
MALELVCIAFISLFKIEGTVYGERSTPNLAPFIKELNFNYLLDKLHFLGRRYVRKYFSYNN